MCQTLLGGNGNIVTFLPSQVQFFVLRPSYSLLGALEPLLVFLTGGDTFEVSAKINLKVSQRVFMQ